MLARSEPARRHGRGPPSASLPRRAGTGMTAAELAWVRKKLEPLVVRRMPLDVPPPRTSRFGSPLVLSRVHWLQPELVAEVTLALRAPVVIEAAPVGSVLEHCMPGR